MEQQSFYQDNDNSLLLEGVRKREPNRVLIVSP
jgi:hypothetical protein